MIWGYPYFWETPIYAHRYSWSFAGATKFGLVRTWLEERMKFQNLARSPDGQSDWSLDCLGIWKFVEFIFAGKLFSCGAQTSLPSDDVNADWSPGGILVDWWIPQCAMWWSCVEISETKNKLKATSFAKTYQRLWRSHKSPSATSLDAGQ